MLIKKEKELNKNQSKQEGQDQSRRNDYEDIVASKEEIDLEEIFDIKKDKATIKPKGKILIYGRAGVGKTTLCQYICYQWAKSEKGLWQDKFDYVFVLPLRKLTSGYLKEAGYGKRLTTIPLECFIHSCITEKVVEETNVDDIKSVLQKDKTLLILDGYDEIANEDTEKNPLIKTILDKAISFKRGNVAVIMTSRPNTLRNDRRQEFEEVENIGLREEDIYKYITNHFKGQSIDIKSINAFIKSNNHIREVVRTPINLYMLCLIWNEKGDLLKGDQGSITLTILYEEMTQWLMKRYLQKGKGISIDKIWENEVEKHCTLECKALEEIAYQGMRNRQIIIRSNLVQQLVPEGENLDPLRILGMLNMVGEGIKIEGRDYEFVHLTFQEYMAARYISKVLAGDDIKYIRMIAEFIEESKYDRFYERMITFLSGLVNKHEGQAQRYFWHIILNGSFNLNADKQMLLLLQCLNEVKADRMQTIPEFKKLKNVLAKYILKAVNKMNIYSFEKICKYQQAVNILLEDYHTQLEGVYITLGNVYNFTLLAAVASNSVAQLIMTKSLPLLKDQDAYVRESVIYAIGKIVTAKPKLFTAELLSNYLLPLLKDQYRYVRKSVVYAIVSIVTAKPELVTAELLSNHLLPLLKDQDAYVRQRVVGAIGKIVTAKSELLTTEILNNHLLPLLKDGGRDKDDVNFFKRKFIVKAMVDILINSELLTAELLSNHLLPLLKDKDIRVGVGYEIDRIISDRPELFTAEILSNHLLPLLKDEDKDVRKQMLYAILYIIRNIPIRQLLLICMNNVVLLELKEITQILLKTTSVLSSKGSLTNNYELIPLIGNNEFERYKTAIKIFNAGYEYTNTQGLPTLFYEQAGNYIKPFTIKRVESIQDLIPTNESLEPASRSLIDNQYKLSALSWTISIIRKRHIVSKNPKHVFLILEGKSIFYTSILHRFELIQQGRKSSIGEIVINTKVNIRQEDLERYCQEMLGNSKYSEDSKDSKFRKGEHYYAKTYAIGFEQVDELCEEVYHEQADPPKYNIRGSEAGANTIVEKAAQFMGINDSKVPGHSCFTWAREKLKKYLDQEEFEKGVLTTWTDIIASDPTRVLGKQH